ncbi:MAG: molybdenum cofactor guanylyltransferase [Anaerolineae bacterium]|nr:molybdenum cofactor guanylyltransferase [Anaerolineae bacterium]
MIEPLITISILAGGQSRRMGRPKSFVNLAGKPLIQHLIELVKTLKYPIHVIANDPEPFKQFGYPVFPDVLTGKGALGGIHTSLSHSETPYTLCLACDMPFINTDLIIYLINSTSHYDAVVPMVNNYPQGLHTIYHRRCHTVIENQIVQDELQVSQVFTLLHTNFIPETTLRHIDPALHAFINLNTPEELQAAEALYRELQGNT